MKKLLLPLLALAAAPLFAEQVTVKQSVILKADRAAVSLKAGTVVELVSRDDDTVTVRYRNVTGKIPASKLDGEAKPAGAPKVAEQKPAAPLPAGAKQPAGQAPGGPQPTTPPARPPQTTYGKAVQKARDNAAAHDKNAVRPADEILDEKK